YLWTTWVAVLRSHTPSTSGRPLVADTRCQPRIVSTRVDTGASRSRSMRQIRIRPRAIHRTGLEYMFMLKEHRGLKCTEMYGAEEQCL
ncbi:hypothetical protein F4780DRAFT_160192, partial [Xylariomycetidae sp. FL0641]